MPLPESCEFDVPVLIWMFLENVCPLSVLNAPQNWASSFGTPSVSPGPPVPRSFRESYHTTARFPVVGSSEIFGGGVERDFRQELAIRCVVVVHPHWDA